MLRTITSVVYDNLIGTGEVTQAFGARCLFEYGHLVSLITGEVPRLESQNRTHELTARYVMEGFLAFGFL